MICRHTEEKIWYVLPQTWPLVTHFEGAQKKAMVAGIGFSHLLPLVPVQKAVGRVNLERQTGRLVGSMVFETDGETGWDMTRGGTGCTCGP